ncbi:MAG: MFS transporter [Patescibacteria group bacterium]|nr:MFS transporter [Patescibacteria group bacterium]
MRPDHKKIPLWPLLLTIFLDQLGVGLVIPILAILLFDPLSTLVPATFSVSGRSLLLGFLIAAYPLTQFFGAPILGALSDRFGRKPILLLSLCGTCIGYALFGIGILTRNIGLLFISRAVSGFLGGNISTAQSAIADLSDEKNRTHNFGLIGAAVGIGYIVGPFVGGKLSDSTIIPWFTFATPFWFATGLSALNLFFVAVGLPETIRQRLVVPLSVWSGPQNVLRAFSLPHLRAMFAVIFLLTFGFSSYVQFYQIHLIEKLHFNQSAIGDLFAYLGLWIAFTQGILIRPLTRRFSSARLLSISTLLLAFTLPMTLLPDRAGWLYALLPLLAVCTGIALPTSTAIISELAGLKTQGEILGINQSVQSLAQAVPPLVAGAIIGIHASLPIFVASVATLLAWLIFLGLFRPLEHKNPAAPNATEVS